MASVRKLKPDDPKSPWIVEYTDASGKRRRKTPKSGLKKDADTLARKIEREMDDGTHTASSQSISLNDLYRSFMDHCQARAKMGDHLTFGTAVAYDTCVRRALPHIGSFKTSEITKPQLQAMIDAISVRFSARSVRSTHEVLYRMFDYAMSKGWTNKNPLAAPRLRLPRGKTEKLIPNRTEMIKLLEANHFDERKGGDQFHIVRNRYAMICTAALTGMRGGELSGLLWKYVDFDRMLISVRHSRSKYDGLKGPKSQAGVRDIPIARPVAEALKALRLTQEHSGPEDLVFQTKDGRVVRAYEISTQYWPTAAKRAGLVDAAGKPRYTMHALRHFAASTFIQHGLSPVHIARVMGHSSVKITMDIYGHLFPEDRSTRDAASAIADSLVRPPKLSGQDENATFHANALIEQRI